MPLCGNLTTELELGDGMHKGFDTVSGSQAGLCETCAHSRRIVNKQGSVFWRCLMSELLPEFPKYPRTPVMECSAYEFSEPGGRTQEKYEPEQCSD